MLLVPSLDNAEIDKRKRASSVGEIGVYESKENYVLDSSTDLPVPSI